MWNKIKKVKNNKKAFSLVELLAVVALVGILFLLAIPAVTHYIEDTKEKTFMINVQTVVNKIKETKATTDIKYCILSDLLDDTKEFKAKNVKTLDIIVYQDESNKTKYAVNAMSTDEKTVIITTDFDKLSLNKRSEWAEGKEALNNLVTEYITHALDEEENILKKEIELCDGILEEIK